MQSPPLPVQLTSASPAPAASRNQNADGGAQFSQALSREMRQQQPKAAPPAKAEAPKPAEAAAPQESTTAEPAAPAKAVSESAKADDSTDSAAVADPAAVNPVFDMLAMLASVNPAPVIAVPGQAPAAATGEPVPAGAARPVADLAPAAGLALPAGARSVLPAGPAAPVVKAGTDALDTSFSNMMGKVDGAMQDGLEAAAATVAQPRGAEEAAAQGAPQASARQASVVAPDATAAAQATPVSVAAPTPLAAAVQREALPEKLVLKETAAAAPAIAPLQAATVAPLQSATALHTAERIAARVGTPAWDNQVAQKIVWMVAGKEQSATLTLNPPDMGPMQVVLSVTNDQASVTFSAAQPEVRQALQDAMPRLREMMGENGIALGNANVHDGSGGQQQQAQGEPGRPGGGVGHVASGSAVEAEARVAARPARSGELPGLVDTFA